MLPKRKGRSGRMLNKKRCCVGANSVAKTVDQNTSKEGGSRKKESGGGGGEVGRKSSSSNSDNMSKSGSRTRRRRRRRMKARAMRERYAEHRKTSRHWGRITSKRTLTTKKAVGCSESSSGSHLPICTTRGHSHSSNFTETKHVSHKGHSNLSSSVDAYFNLGSRINCFKLPWANLNVPMDLSQIELEVRNNDRVDFELLAEKNHQRWCANVMRAQE